MSWYSEKKRRAQDKSGARREIFQSVAVMLILLAAALALGDPPLSILKEQRQTVSEPAPKADQKESPGEAETETASGENEPEETGGEAASEAQPVQDTFFQETEDFFENYPEDTPEVSAGEAVSEKPSPAEGQNSPEGYQAWSDGDGTIWNNGDLSQDDYDWGEIGW
ncbi:MAG: hypothetical protein Q4C55_03940 [Eubacterium sp.]|nr:hypothetical protein [Eubacterium sp.]